MDSPLLDMMRTVAISGEYVSSEGRRDKLKDRPAVARGLNTIDILALILGHLGYQDLSNVYNVCAGFRQVIDSFTTLRRTLFLAPNYACRPHFIPLKIFHALPVSSDLSQPHQHLPVFTIEKEALDRLRKTPKIQLLDRLMIQPPLRHIYYWLDLTKHPYGNGWAGSYEVTNENGITFGDLIDSFVRFESAVKSVIEPKWRFGVSLKSCEFVAPPS